MKSIFLLCSMLAVSDASECQADENSLLQSRKLVRTTKIMGSDNSHVVLEKLQDVANSLLEGSDTTMTTDEVNDALDAASQALAELAPAIRQQVVTAQQQITDATAAVRACHTGEQAELRTSLQSSMGQRAAAVESCHNTLNGLQAAETQQCGIAEDCLCDEARVRTTDQEALCAAITETYEVAFCEHHHVCTLLHQCHSDEAEVYRALRADVEAEMEVIRQEYIAVEQSQCLTGLIMEAMTPPVTPISHAALIACDDVDASALNINFPHLPAEPAACPAHAHGDPQCGGDSTLRWVWTNGNEACDPACGRESMTCDQSAFPVGLEATQAVYNAMGLNCGPWHLENAPFDPCFGHHPDSAGRCNYVDREQLTTCSASCGWRRICPCRSSTTGPAGTQLQYANPDRPNGLCISMSTARGAGCDHNGVCVGHGNSDATLQNCDVADAGQLWSYTGGQLHSSLFPNACLTVGSSSNHGACEPFTLQECSASNTRQQFNRESVAGTTVWRNTATNLAIDSDSYRNTVDNWIWACPGTNTAKYFNLLE